MARALADSGSGLAQRKKKEGVAALPGSQRVNVEPRLTGCGLAFNSKGQCLEHFPPLSRRNQSLKLARNREKLNDKVPLRLRPVWHAPC